MKIQFKKTQIPYIVLIVFGIVLFTMGIANHYFFRTVAYDYANYSFAFWDYSHFRMSIAPAYGGKFIQDHFSFTLMYFVPIYWLLNWLTETYTLILIQYSLVLLAAWYTYKLILLKTDNIWLGVGVLIYYFTLIGRYTTFSCDVNLAVMSACFIPVFLYTFETRKYFLSFIILILSLFSRENIPIWFISIFMVLIIQHYKEKLILWYSFLGISLCIIYFILLFNVFIPSIETDKNRFTLFNYSALGEDPVDAILFILNHPIETIKLFFTNHTDDQGYNYVKAEFYLVYLISGGFLLLLKLKYLIWFIPIVAQKVLNDNFIRWGIATYYSIEVVTLLPLSVFLVLASIKSKSVQNFLTITVCILTIGTTIYKLNPKNCVLPWTMTPEKEQIYNVNFFTPPFNIEKVNELIKQIPPKAKVSASNHLLPHLAQRQFNYFFPIVKDAEYIIINVTEDNYLKSQFENDRSRNKYLSDPNWELVAQEYPIFLLKLKQNDGSNTKESLLINRFKCDTLKCDYETFSELNKHVLFSNNEKCDTTLHLNQENSLSGIYSMKLTPDNPTGQVIKIADINQVNYLQISVWCYCSDLQQANIVARSGDSYYKSSNEGDQKVPSGWNRLVLGLWIPENIDTSNFSIYLWYNGQESAYFDDLQIIKRFKD